jgi:hypothetical protein
MWHSTYYRLQSRNASRARLGIAGTARSGVLWTHRGVACEHWLAALGGAKRVRCRCRKVASLCERQSFFSYGQSASVALCSFKPKTPYLYSVNVRLLNCIVTVRIGKISWARLP